ncbi:MAG: DUF6528 family protein [Opitutaceae bacterium]|jgi:hypothetical protein|nr:DUF6528 family protein [Opitutaceae bacterium]
MKKIFLITVSLLFATAGLPGAADNNLIIACGEDQVYVIDGKTSNGAALNIVWHWQVSEAKSQLPKEYQRYLSTLDECKLVDNNSKLLLTSSAGGVLLLDCGTKKCLFYARAPNAHSVELLPGLRIAVACSTSATGNRVDVYDLRQPEKVLFKDPLPHAHGVVWMPERQRLYALGHEELREYSLEDWDTASPKLKQEKKWKTPVTSGHDLSRVSKKELLVAGHNGVVSFNIDEEKFTPFKPLRRVMGIKSVNYNEETGRLLYTKSEEGWWTYNITQKNPDKVLTLPDLKIYKARMVR